MAAPTFQSASTVIATDTTNPVTLNAPASVAVGDLLVAVVEAGVATLGSFGMDGSGAGWTNLFQFGFNAAVGNTCLGVCAKVAAGSDVYDFTINGGMINHCTGRVARITGHGVATPSTDIVKSATNGSGTAGTTGTALGITTLSVDNLILMIGGTARDANSTADFSAWTNANLSSITEQMDNVTLSGNGGGFGMASAVSATAQAIGSSTWTLVSAEWTGVQIAIPPPAAAKAPPFTQRRGLYVPAAPDAWGRRWR